MLSIGRKKYRNLPEQAAFNTTEIEKIWEALDGLDVYDNVIIIETLNPLTPAQLDIVDKPVAFIVYNNVLYMKRGVGVNEVYFDQVFNVSDDGTKITLGSSEITVSYPLGTLAVASTTCVTYNKTKLDLLLADKADKSDTYTKAQSKLAAYPVGSIYMANNNSDSPASLFGGNWQALNSGNPIYLPISSKMSVFQEESVSLFYSSAGGTPIGPVSIRNSAAVSAGSDGGANNFYLHNDGTSSTPQYGNIMLIRKSNNITPTIYGDLSDGIAVYMWERVPD